MKIQKLLITVLLLITLASPLISNELESTSKGPVTFNMELPPELETGYRPEGYGGPAVILIIIVGGFIGGGAVVSSMVCPIVFTSLYLETYGDQEANKIGMLATLPIFSLIIAAGITTLESSLFYTFAPAIIAPISGLLAFGSLVPAIIMTDRYVRLGDVSREVTAGLAWSWNSFGMFIIPAIVGAIIGLKHAGDEIRYRREKRERVSLIVGLDRIGVSIKL